MGTAFNPDEVDTSVNMIDTNVNMPDRTNGGRMESLQRMLDGIPIRHEGHKPRLPN